MEKTTAILVNYKNYTMTRDAVDSLLRQTVALRNIVVVDNSSCDGSFERLRLDFAGNATVTVLGTERNGGFAYGNNVGLRFALDHLEQDYFLLINNDTLAEANLNEEFIKFFDQKIENGGTALLTGKIFYENPADELWFAGGALSEWKVMGSHFGEDTKDSGSFSEEREITFATGCLWFFSVETLKKADFMDESLFLYYEDTEYCMRLRRLGIKIFYLPQAKIYHRIGRQKRVSNFYYNNRNRIWIAKKYHGTLSFFAFVAFLALTKAVRFIQLLSRGKIINTFDGMRDGLTGHLAE